MSDRLLTLREGGQLTDWFDRASKTILVHALDGTLSIGYAGLAHIRSMPTDLWLIEQIQGRPISEPRLPGGGPPTFESGPPVRLTIHEIHEKVRTAIERDLPAEPARESGLEVIMAGWRWNRRTSHTKRSSTYVAILIHSGAPNTSCIVTYDRPWLSGIPNYRLAGIGARSVFRRFGLPKFRECLDAQNSAITWLAMEHCILQSFTSAAATKNSMIGREAMSVVMPELFGSPTLVRFFRDRESTRIAGYTPAIITNSGLVQYPSLYRGQGSPISISRDRPVSFETLPPVPPQPDGPIFEIGSYPRRTWP